MESEGGSNMGIQRGGAWKTPAPLINEKKVVAE